MKKNILKIYYLLNAILKIRSHKFVYYYKEHKNVGDLVSIDICNNMFGFPIYTFPGIRYFEHYLMVGSVLGGMNRKSRVWGSGLISENEVDGVAEIGKIYAVRGHYTKSKLEQKFKITLDVPLGDPALLLPKIYPPVPAIKKKYKIGIVAHYVDVGNTWLNHMLSLPNIVNVDVALSVHDFINLVQECEYILSSSLHGLIIADAYNVPNYRLQLSGKIVGGDFKFMDYYSTTDSPNAYIEALSPDRDENNDILKLTERCYVKNYKYDLLELYLSNPFERS